MCATPIPGSRFAWAVNAWRLVVFIAFGLLCFRLLLAACTQGKGDSIVPLWLAGVGGAMAWLNPGATLFAFAAGLPLMNGIERLGVPLCAPPTEVLFSSIYLGWLCRWAREQRASVFERNPVTLLADLFTTLVLISIVMSVCLNLRGSDVPELWQVSRFGFGAPFFGLTAGFALASGTMFLRLVAIVDERKWFQGRGIGSLAATHALALIGFVTYQLITRTPELYRTHLSSGGISYVPTLPGDDIHTLGSIAVLVFGFGLGLFTTTSMRSRIWWGAVALVGASVVVLSWSRAAWLAALCIIPLWMWRRGFRRFLAVSFIIFVVLVSIVAVLPVASKDLNNPYAQRLMLLIDVGHWLETNSDRTTLYKRAARIIEAHPVLGIGAGNYYNQSPAYEAAGGLGERKFAHNAFLQIGAESGLPASLCFIALLTVILGRTSPLAEERGRIAYEGAWLAAVGMLITQLTANAINIFAGQMLLLCVYLSGCRVERRIRAPGRPG